MSTPAPASIKVSVEGNVTQAVYDPQQENSCVLLSFCRINHLPHRLGICSSAVAVELHTGKYFSCTMKLIVIDRISDPINIILGRDWFNLCSTGLEDQPDSAVRLLSSSQWLIFAVSPFTAVRTQLPSSDSYDKKICLASHSRDIILILSTQLAPMLIVALLVLMPAAPVPLFLRKKKKVLFLHPLAKIAFLLIQ